MFDAIAADVTKLGKFHLDLPLPYLRRLTRCGAALRETFSEHPHLAGLTCRRSADHFRRPPTLPMERVIPSFRHRVEKATAVYSVPWSE